MSDDDTTAPTDSGAEATTEQVTIDAAELAELRDAAGAAEKIRTNNAKLLEETARKERARKDLAAKLRDFEKAEAEREDKEIASTADIDKIRAHDRDKFQAELAKREDRISELEARFRKVLVGQELASAFDAHNIDPMQRKVLQRFFEADIQLVEDEAAEYGFASRIEGLPIGEYVESFALSDLGAKFVLVPPNGSGGPRPNGGKAPPAAKRWKPKASMSAAEKVEAIRELGAGYHELP